jgi:hypothetical protein
MSRVLCPEYRVLQFALFGHGGALRLVLVLV